MTEYTLEPEPFRNAVRTADEGVDEADRRRKTLTDDMAELEAAAMSPDLVSALARLRAEVLDGLAEQACMSARGTVGLAGRVLNEYTGADTEMESAADAAPRGTES
ncbi:hypothetical protein [Micrococcus luteus]|uniref:hypothetical protein n=1 Tax=Micrococcus luteus TaxID=1270 RepID=UPI0037940F3A